MKTHLKTYDGGIYTYQQMRQFIEDWDMFESESEDDEGNLLIQVALTNPADDSPFPDDCGEFVLNEETNLYTFKFYN